MTNLTGQQLGWEGWAKMAVKSRRYSGIQTVFNPHILERSLKKSKIWVDIC
jgi:hypothetical protein